MYPEPGNQAPIPKPSKSHRVDPFPIYWSEDENECAGFEIDRVRIATSPLDLSFAPVDWRTVNSNPF